MPWNIKQPAPHKFYCQIEACIRNAEEFWYKGVYGYPKEEALDNAVGYIQIYANDMDVVLVLFDAEAFEIAKRKYQEFLK